MLHQSRPGKGGGVAVAFKTSLNLQRCKSQYYKSFEHIECVLDSSNSGHLRLVSVYRSCTARLSNLKCFFEEFDDYLDSLTNLPGPPLESREPRNIVLSKFCSAINYIINK